MHYILKNLKDCEKVVFGDTYEIDGMQALINKGPEFSGEASKLQKKFDDEIRVCREKEKKKRAEKNRKLQDIEKDTEL